MKATGLVVILIALLSAAFTDRGPQAGNHSVSSVPVVAANDNRTPAGVLRKDTLRIALLVQIARWFPEAADGPSVEVATLGEVGRAPQIPAPLIRVREGTTIVASVRNSLSDSVIWIRGLAGHPSPIDSVPINPGASHTFTFSAGAPGTYIYSATPGHIVPPARAEDRRVEQDQLAGAFVVDPIGAPVNDRVLVINIWGNRLSPTKYRNALAINGKAWPFTERIAASVGDSIRWRVINASARRHPMHLHGFYFRVDSRGTSTADTAYSADQQRLAVTEDMAPGTTVRMAWSPDRPGNWLFHCHLTFHVTNRGRLDGAGDEHAIHGTDPTKHMAGLVMGINVKPRKGQKQVVDTEWTDDRKVRRLRLFASERARQGHTPLAMSYVLQRGTRAPAADSVELPGQPIVLTRGEPTQITVLNRTHDGTAVHWHGIELESYSDGVPGWSGIDKIAPMVAPKDSFIARLSLKRAGTFIYHTHINDVEQLTSGMYGPIIVLEPGEKYDPTRDHTFTIGWDGPEQPAHILINGDSMPPPLEIKAGTTHRLRFVNIGPALRFLIRLDRDTSMVTWKSLAKDGADLPTASRKTGPSFTLLDVGETFDAEFNPPAPGEYRLSVVNRPLNILRTRRIIVR
jgi:manganese oxidase